MNTKKWYVSVTLWANVAMAIVIFVQQLGQFLPIPAEVLAYVAVMGNFLLRFKTSTGVTK